MSVVLSISTHVLIYWKYVGLWLENVGGDLKAGSQSKDLRLTYKDRPVNNNIRVHSKSDGAMDGFNAMAMIFILHFLTLK